MTSKLEMLQAGEKLLGLFCHENGMRLPRLVQAGDRWPFEACAFYRPERIEINISKCATIGHTGQSWSYPGYKIDRTPYGVLQHELGHHADWLKGSDKGAYFSDYSSRVRLWSEETKLTNYCPNDAEWFAEMFRLFVTNPDLLKCSRPATFELLKTDFQPVEKRTWQEVLKHAPLRTIEKCTKFDW